MSTLTTSLERVNFDVFNKEVHALREIPTEKVEEAKRLVKREPCIAPSGSAVEVIDEHLNRRRYSLRLAKNAFKYVQATPEPVEKLPVELEIDIDSHFYLEHEWDCKQLFGILHRYHVFDGRRNIGQVNLRFIDEENGDLLRRYHDSITTTLLECGVKVDIAQRAKPKMPSSADRLFDGRYGNFGKDELNSLFSDWDDNAKA